MSSTSSCGEQEFKLNGSTYSYAMPLIGKVASPLESQPLWAQHSHTSNAFTNSSISPDMVQELSSELLHPDDMVLSPDSFRGTHSLPHTAASSTHGSTDSSAGSKPFRQQPEMSPPAGASSSHIPSIRDDDGMDFDEHPLDLGGSVYHHDHFDQLESPANALSTAASMFTLPESHGALASPQNFDSTLSGNVRTGRMRSPLTAAMTDTDIAMSSPSLLSMDQSGGFSFDPRSHVISQHGLSHVSTSSQGGHSLFSTSSQGTLSQGGLSHVSTSSRGGDPHFSTSSHQQTVSVLSSSSAAALSSPHDYSFPSLPDPTLYALSQHQLAAAGVHTNIGSFYSPSSADSMSTNFSEASRALFPATASSGGGSSPVPPRPTAGRARSGGAVGRLAGQFDEILAVDFIKTSPDAPSIARSSSLPQKTHHHLSPTPSHAALSHAATLPISSTHSSPTMTAPPLVGIPSLVSYGDATCCSDTNSPSADRDSLTNPQADLGVSPPANSFHIPSIATPTDGMRRSSATGSSSSRSWSREKRAAAGLSSDKKVTPTPTRGRKKRSCENCFFAKTACDGQRPCNRCTRLKKPSCKDRVPVKREQFKYAGGVGGQVVPFLPASHLSAFGLPSTAFSHLEQEPMYAVTDIGVHLKAIKESVVRAYKRCASILRKKPQMAISSISYDVENLSLPGSLTEIEMINELKEIVGLSQDTVIPRDLRKFERYRDTNAEGSEFFPSVIRKDMNQRCGVIRYTTTKDVSGGGGGLRMAYNCNNRLRTMYGLSKQTMDAMGFVFSPRFIHPDDWEEIVCDSLRSLDIHSQSTSDERESHPEDRFTSVRPIRMLNRSGRMAPVVALTYESSRSVTEQSMMIVLVPVAT